MFKIYEFIVLIIYWTIIFIGIKAIIIGIDFSFYKWIKYGHEYWNWYLAKRAIPFIHRNGKTWSGEERRKK